MYNRKKWHDEEINKEISLTPLIDTVLVLLIVFIAATPVIHNSFKVSLPDGVSCETYSKKNALPFAIDQYGRIYDSNKKIISLKQLDEYWFTINDKKNISVVFFVDKDASCNILIQCIDICKKNGINHVYCKTKKII